MDFPTISSFNEIVDLVDENVLVVLDIDETILTISSFKDPAKHTDKDGLFNLLKKVEKHKTDLLFLTARHYDSDSYTKDDFKELGLPDNLIVVYCALLDKGYCLKKILDENPKLNKTNIIFIDDMDHNLHAVKSLGNANCFRFTI